MAPEAVRAFFIALPDERRSILKLLTPVGTIKALAAREFVVVLTDARLRVLRMGGLGVFSARLVATELEYAATDAPLAWDDGKVVIAGNPFWPFNHHDEDAQQLVLMAHGMRHGDAGDPAPS